mmetsp:Transcript_26285/g.36628  ORF Transcript_26285/g.36628 Transcript_26285/m.36628 type:complete len:693 (-) Transcript_26285:167-2245(-)
MNARTRAAGYVLALGILGTSAVLLFSSRLSHEDPNRVLQLARPMLLKARTSRTSRFARPGGSVRFAESLRQRPQMRRGVNLKAEDTTVVNKPSGYNPSSGKDSLSALDGMLGGAETSVTGSSRPEASETESSTKAKSTLDLLSGWFGPDETELEREKEMEERRRKAKEREEETTSLTVITEKDDRMPDEVMRQLGINANSNMTDGMRTEMAESLLEDLRERAKNGDEKDKELMEAVSSFLDTAQKFQSLNVSENELRNDFVNLLDKLQPENRVDAEDMAAIKKEILGPKTFFVTSSDNAAKFDGVFGLRDTGYVFCGNFRGNQREKFLEIEGKVKERFGDKYEVLLIPDPELEVDPFYDADPAFTKAALQVVPADKAQPTPEAPWGLILSIGLFAFYAFGALQLGGQAASVQLPEETVKWLANPDNFKSYDPSFIPPGVLDWDPSMFLRSVGQVGAGALAVSLIHEAGHRIAAALRNVKLGTPYFLPLGNIPTSFGSITPLKSLVKSHEDLFDIAAAGPLSGVILGSILFAAGLLLTGSTPQAELVAMPYPFVEQSLLLGTMVKAALGVGDGALVSDALLVHPLVIAGWVGLVAQAFNSLPVGALDGGRMVQATFGNGPLGFTSLLTYGALGFGLLGGPVDGLLFGLYLLFLQRNPEKYIQDTVTLADDKTRRGINLFLVIFAALVLTPLGS